MGTDFEKRIRDMEWPEPPPELRDRILSHAAGAFAEAGPVTWSDRLWFSRTFRWSVAAAFAALIALGQWPESNASDGGSERNGLAMTGAQILQDVVEDAGVPPDFAASLVRRTLIAGGPAASPQETMATLQLLERNGER